MAAAQSGRSACSVTTPMPHASSDPRRSCIVGKGWGGLWGFPGGSGRFGRHTHIAGPCSAEAVEAIDRARQIGLVVVLVTGRIGVELAAEFPDIADHFDVLVLENGAVAVTDGELTGWRRRWTVFSMTRWPSGAAGPAGTAELGVEGVSRPHLESSGDGCRCAGKRPPVDRLIEPRHES